MRRVRVLLVEDHDLLADSVAAALTAEGYDVVRPATLDAPSVLASAEEAPVDVALVDLRLSEETTALPLIPQLREAGAAVLMVTGETDTVALAECVEAGAIGLLHKSVALDELIDAVHHVAELGTHMTKEDRDELLQQLREHRRADSERLGPFRELTAREQQVLSGLMDGLSAEAIAQRDFVSIATIRSHIRSILTRLGVGSQLAAVALARAAGWAPDAR